MSTDFSTSTGTIRTFSTVDYVVLSVLMGLSAAIGLYHAIKDRIQKKENMTEFLLGGRSMSVVPVALSLSVTFLSAITILGNPAVTGLNIWGCVIGIGIVVTFYTSLGGMKAVLWTDSLQFFVMIAGLLAIFIQGCKETGGFSAAWDLAEKRKRIVFDDFSFDPSTRHSVWSVTVGGWMLWTALFGVNQAQVQRCLSTSSVRKAQLAILLNTPALVGIVILCCLIGIVMFAFYADCDPLSFGLIEKTDQLLPLFVMDILGDLRGIPGLFVSCVFSGNLSSISSALNAIATVAFKDFLQQFCCSGVSELTATIINKALGK
ncbi:sodium-coupled monocarboxylate transporter 2 [Aplysia californica]|uniref:Sodium-coupled monocarboxylate transporter 2 n=1 Tax=Aplysia californica TaxID=6500 RepID=A0ABM1A1A6_APLCA|nr:sodium-coupled monocarboxylate transporter 2 [Aplysia californica]